MWITLFWFVTTNKCVTNRGFMFVCFLFCFWWKFTTPFCSFMNGSHWIDKSFSVSKATLHKAQKSMQSVKGIFQKSDCLYYKSAFCEAITFSIPHIAYLFPPGSTSNMCQSEYHSTSISSVWQCNSSCPAAMSTKLRQFTCSCSYTYKKGLCQEFAHSLHLHTHS